MQLPAHHVAFYSGKAVLMDYITNKKEQFRRAAQRIADNGASGFVITPKGQVYAVTRDKRMASPVTGEHAEYVLDQWRFMASDFALANDPPPHIPTQFDNHTASAQRKLISGLNCLPGQLELFE
jgi:hypothetical protein